MNSTFANSKFFQKRINKAAVKIQALCRAFLAQARVFRQRKLEPRLQELKDCEVRKREELSRIAEQLKEEREKAPEDVKKDFEASEGVIEKLKEDIDYYTKENEELKEQRKEVKKKNKELQHENKEHNEAEFKVQCQITKLNKEINYTKPTADKYEYALEFLKNEKADTEEKIVRVTQQKSVMKKCIGKIIKMVEEQAGNTSSSSAKKVSPPSSPRRGGRRKSIKSGHGATSATKKKPARSKSADDPVPSYDWSNQKTPIMLEDDSLVNNDDSMQGSLQGSFQGSLAKLMVDDGPADKNNNSVNSRSKKSGSGKSSNHSHGEGGAAFDWATKSYNNFAINFEDDEPEAAKVEAPKQRRQQRHSIHVSSSHQPPLSRSLHKSSSSRKLGGKSSSSRNLGGKSSSHHKSKDEPAASGHDSMRELLRELKAIKKELKH